MTSEMEKTDRLIWLTDRLRQEETLSGEELKQFLITRDQKALEYLYKSARDVCVVHYGKKVYARGLIEFTNYCRNN